MLMLTLVFDFLSGTYYNINTPLQNNIKGTNTMNTINDIKNLSREEKLKVMEALWEDLSHDEEKVASPDWHGDALRETEKRVATGKEDRVGWSDAKKELRKRFE